VDILSEPYERLGIKRIINAATCLTSLGGSIPDLRVFEAMVDASKSFIQIPVLQKAAGQRIADLLGAEAGLPTAGAVNAIMLAVASCMFKDTELENHDPVGSTDWTKIIQKLPLHTAELKNEFVLLGNSRSEYDHAIEIAGGKRVQAGSKDDVTAQDLRNTFTEKTAALYYTMTPTATMPVKEFCDIAHELGVPAIVDAAPFLTHKGIPVKILADGADLVIFSGGKQLGCINNTGILIGRKDLLKLAHLNSYPFDGIARGCKMSRETIMGLLRAVEIFVNEDRNEYYKAQHEKSKALAKRFDAIDGITSGVIFEPNMLDDATAPSLVWVEVENGCVSLRTLYEKLLNGSPVIRTLYEPLFLTKEGGNRVTFKVEYLIPGDDDIIVRRVAEIMAQ
jgi:D-glucosaminate-6-phosphate ammonia-lyase